MTSLRTTLFVLSALVLSACMFPPAQDMSDSGNIEEQEQSSSTTSVSPEAEMEDEVPPPTEDELDEEEAMEGDVTDQEEEVMSAGVYTDYSDGVLTNGETKLLFFHASWCPFCIQNDLLLKKLYDEETLANSTYKIDYDTSAELKAQYGVVTQDTVVLVGGNGDAIGTKIHPNEGYFLDVLQ